MNSKKEFRAPAGFEIANVQLTPEQKSWFAKTRDAVGRVFSKRKSIK